MNKKTGKVMVVFLLYIVMIVIKNYFIDIYFYMRSDENYNIKIQLISAFSQAVIMIVWGIVCAHILNANNKRDKVIKKDVALSVVGGILCFLTFNTAKNGYEMFRWFFVSEKIDIKNHNQVEISVFLVIVLVLGIWFAIGEELVYRKVLCLDLSESVGVKCSYIISVVLFVLAHSSVEQMIQAFFVALILNYLILRKKSLVSCIVLHAIYNICGLISTYIYPAWLTNIFGISDNMVKEDIFIGGLYMFMAFLLLMFLVIFVINLYNKTNSNKKS